MEHFNGEPVTDGITAGVDLRKQRGLEIAALAKIEKKGDVWIVPSQYSTYHMRYRVRYGENPTCTCPDHEQRHCRCKHIYAVEYVMRREQHADGSESVTESVTVSKTRRTYPQNWPAYNAAQTNEKDHFQSLLHELCKDMGELPPTERKGPQGRKPIPLSDAVFAAVFKVYSTVSARRFACDLADAKAKGHITKAPHFNSVLNYLENPALFPILTAAIERSSLPLKSVETDFAVDSTGFTTSRFVRWFDVKYGRFTAEQQWVKAHICTGVKTNIVTAIEVKEMYTHDGALLPPLVETTAKNFTISEVSADKGYSSGESHNAIAKAGAAPYIAFRNNASGSVGGLFAKMFHFFQFKRDEFLAHYHKRSNVESTVMMIKSKFGDAVRSKSDVAARNEVLCKVLAHNLCCLVSAFYELGIQADFGNAA